MASELKVAGSGDLQAGSRVVVFFCDIPDAGKLAHRLGGAWPAIMSRYQEIVGSAVEQAGGHVEDGDQTAFFVTFVDENAARNAVVAAAEVQRRLREFTPSPKARAGKEGDTPDGSRTSSANDAHGAVDNAVEINASIGLHTGVIGESVFLNELGGPRFIGLGVHRCARVRASGRPGQVLVTEDVHRLITDTDIEFEDLGFHRLRDFPDSIRLFNLVVFDDRRAEFFEPPKTLDYRPTNLTADDRPLLGREGVIAAVKAAFLDDHRRLVTLTGPGGVGKTRVGIAAGIEQLEEHHGGVWLIRAETLRRTEQLLPAIAVVLNVRDIPGQSLLDAIVRRMEFSPILLVIDNLEQLTGAGDVVAELIDRTTSLQILTTSQTPLRVGSETVIPVPVLTLDDAVEWFRLAARTAGSTLDLINIEIKQQVVDLVDRLDRLPLAIELAAAQLRHLTLQQLAEGIESQLELQAAEPGKPERQQSLAAIINWSVAALPPQAKLLFTRLGVFTGITTLELIEEICGQNINVLEAAATLVDYSLLRRAYIGFGMPPSIQQTATKLLTKSNEENELRHLHAKALVKQALALDADRMDAELSEEGKALDGNFMSAVSWARASDKEAYLQLVLNLARWWMHLGRMNRGLRELSTALELDFISTSTRSTLLRRRSLFYNVTGSLKRGLADAKQSVELAGQTPSIELGNALLSLSLAQFGIDPAASATAAADAAQLFRRLNRPDRILTALCLHAQALVKANRPNDAEEALREAAVIAPTQQTVYARSGLSNITGDWALATDKPILALESYSKALSKEWSRFLMSYDIAGIVMSLARLEEYEPVVELLIALKSAGRELGLVVERLSQDTGWPEGILQAARDTLTAKQVAEAQARGDKLSGGQLATRTLTVVNEVLEKYEAKGTRPQST